MHREAEERRQLETELRSALKNGQLTLAYQPIIASHTQKIDACEALLRWTHPPLGAVQPDKFVPLAEEAALITSISHLVIRTPRADPVNFTHQRPLATPRYPPPFPNTTPT